MEYGLIGIRIAIGACMKTETKVCVYITGGSVSAANAIYVVVNGEIKKREEEGD